jgi:hypothetical protein
MKYDWEYEGAILLPKGIAKYDVNVADYMKKKEMEERRKVSGISPT